MGKFGNLFPLDFVIFGSPAVAVDRSRLVKSVRQLLSTRATILLAGVITALLANHSWAGAYESGLAAYNAKDFKRAESWYLVGAAQGDAQAQYNLGLMYANGIGESKDYVRGYMWLSIAAPVLSQKVADAMVDLVASRMSREQLLQARAMAQACERSHFSKCG